MGHSYGQRSLGGTGGALEVSADGSPEMKQGGVTLDWGDVAAVSGSDVTLNDGTVIPVGKKYLRYGQVVCMKSVQEVQVVTVDATGGTFKLTGVRPDTGAETETVAIAEAAAAATVQTALEAVFGAGNVTVSGSAGGPFTVTFGGALLGYDVATLEVSDDSTTGGTGVSVATTTGGGNYGKYGPYDDEATDGRQTLTRGRCFVLNKTVVEDDLHSDHPPALYGGLCWKDRIKLHATAASLADGPTLADFLTAFPRIQFVSDPVALP